jgi:hemerythrin
MQQLEWTDKYLTGIEIIDEQHKRIFKSVNALFDACEKVEKKEKILELIGHLDFYTDSHFSTEEKYMIKLEYPEYPEHKKAHEYFKGIYEKIRNNYIYKKGEVVYILAIHLNQTLADWLDYHLQNEDQRLAVFLKSRLNK